MKLNCPNCGGVTSAEVCPYCGTHIDISTKDISPDYTMKSYKSGKITFWNTGFWSIFAVSFLVIPICIVIPISTEADVSNTFAITFLIPFLLVGLGTLFKVISSLYIAISLKLYGKNYSGIVYGYMDDNISYNGVNGQQVKILIENKGMQYILLPLESTSKPYPVNSKIKVRIFKKYANIIEEYTL